MIVCSHRPPCPGCPRLGAADLDSDARGRLTALSTELGLGPLRVERGAGTHFRRRARLAVRGRASNPKVGLFEPDSHRVVDIPRCVVHHPLVNEVAHALRKAIRTSRAAPYSDEAHKGLVRYAQVVVARPTTTAQVVVVTNAETAESSAALLSALEAELGRRLHSLFWNGNPGRTNRILGAGWHHVMGEAAVEERIGGARVFFPPGAFGQSNLDLAERIVETVHGWVPSGARVLECYAGVGPIGLGLVGRSASVTFNEISADSLAGLERGIAALDERSRSRTRVVAGPASLAPARGELSSADVVIVDPPRKGLDVELTMELVASPPERLIYVACGLSSFLTDTRALLAAERLRLAELVVFDLFPHTEHVEVVARFERGAEPLPSAASR